MRLELTAFAAAAALVAAAPAMAQSSGVTSGPAVGSPATLGTGGTVPASPHQTETVRNGGGVPIQSEQGGQTGGTRNTVAPGASDAGSGTTRRP